MFQFFAYGTEPRPPQHKEGDLYKVVNIHGHTFALYYGYYEDYERENPTAEPMPIYPDFLKAPCYSKDGFAFVTQMQDACRHYKGDAQKDRDCADCAYYEHGDELLGICRCEKRKQAHRLE